MSTQWARWIWLLLPEMEVGVMGKSVVGSSQHKFITLIRERPDGISQICCKCGDGGKKKTLDRKGSKF